MRPGWAAAAIEEAARVHLAVLRSCAAPLPPDSPVVITALRNERRRIGDFLHHYRAAGIRRFCVVDNGSSDGTAELLAAQPDVELLSTDRPFGSEAKSGWVIAAMRRLGPDRWFIVADADELIVFDGIETRGFDALARAMDARGIRRVRGIMLDMYPEGPVLGAADAPDARLLDLAPCHDAAGYREQEVPWGWSITGDPLRRLTPGRKGPNVQLSKLAMFRPRGEEVPAHAHYLWPPDATQPEPRHLALLHFRFLPDIVAKAREAVAQGGYFDGSAIYRHIGEAFEANPGLSLMAPHSRRYDGSRALVEAGLIGAVPWDGAAPPPPPDGAVSTIAPKLPRTDADLLRQALIGVDAACVFGLGPALRIILRGADPPFLVAVEEEESRIDAFARLPEAEAARGRLVVLRAEGASWPVLPWPAWATAGRRPGLVVVAGRYRVASALAALRDAPGAAILFAAFHPARPEYQAVARFTDEVARGRLFALLRPKAGLDRAVLDAAFAAHRDDPR